MIKRHYFMSVKYIYDERMSYKYSYSRITAVSWFEKSSTVFEDMLAQAKDSMGLDSNISVEIVSFSRC